LAGIKDFLNTRRLRDYPRLMLITTLGILAINLFLHQGWLGAFGQVIGGDFVMFYSTGSLYRTDPARIYDYAEQYRLQQSLVEPIKLNGLNPFMNPPYMAMLFSLITYLPLLWSLILWTFLSIIFTFLSVHLISPLVPYRLRQAGLSNKQYLILVFSFFPFIEGLLAGQNHALTLLLVTALLVSAHKECWFLSGILAGTLIYKPQLVLGLLIVWAIWKNFKALFGFSIVAILWAGSYVLIHSITPFIEYLQVSQFFMSLPYIEGFPGYIIITFYGLLTSIFPANTAPTLQLTSHLIFILASGLVAWFAWHQRHSSPSSRMPVLLLCLILPLAFSPYVQLHDLLLVAPIFLFWARYDNSSRVFNSAIFTYAGAFILTLFAALTGIAWLSLITLVLFFQMVISNHALIEST